MAIQTNTPEVHALKRAVEKRYGHSVDSRTDFMCLAIDIERVTHEHIAENTLRRLWGRLRGYDTAFTRTLDVMSRYVGYAHWVSFCDDIKRNAGRESDIVSGKLSVKSADLEPGDRIRIGWLPDRLCVVEYIGGLTFKAIQTQNSTLQVGDTFECNIMLKDYPLFVDNLVHGGELCQRYAIGIDSGLKILEKL